MKRIFKIEQASVKPSRLSLSFLVETLN